MYVSIQTGNMYWKDAILFILFFPVTLLSTHFINSINDFSRLKTKTYEICTTYNNIFEGIEIIRVVKLYTGDIGNSYNEICMEEILRCLSKSSKTVLLNTHFAGRIIMKDNMEDFAMRDNETIEANINKDVKMVRMTTVPFDKGIVVVAEYPEEILYLFKEKARAVCHRCLHIFVITHVKIDEIRIYTILKQLWDKYFVMNVIFHGVRSESEYYLYSYNPFYLR